MFKKSHMPGDKCGYSLRIFIVNRAIKVGLDILNIFNTPSFEFNDNNSRDTGLIFSEEHAVGAFLTEWDGKLESNNNILRNAF